MNGTRNVAVAKHTVVVLVDQKPVETPRETTPRGLLALVGVDPATRMLVRVHGKRHEKFEDPDAQITVKHDQAFITVRVGPMPVS